MSERPIAAGLLPADNGEKQNAVGMVPAGALPAEVQARRERLQRILARIEQVLSLDEPAPAGNEPKLNDAGENMTNEEHAEQTRRWLAWSAGRYPDDSPGDVIAVWRDGTIMLDDSITTWNPLRALAFLAGGGWLSADGLAKASRRRKTVSASSPQRVGKVAVLAHYPKAFAWSWANQWEIYLPTSLGNQTLGRGKTASEAWRAAGAALPEVARPNGSASASTAWVAELEAARHRLGELRYTLSRIFSAEAWGAMKEADRVLSIAIDRERRSPELEKK